VLATHEEIYMKTGSQAYQDLFVLNLIGKNGTYIEIGGNHPKLLSNTYWLERKHNWSGFSIEYDSGYREAWEISGRKNKIYWEDALSFDYVNAIEENNLPKKINYLSCDIEPPENTFSALQRVIEQGITFDVITFEHDNYSFPESTIKNDVINYLLNNNYKIAVSDVYFNKPENNFEIWFVSADFDFEPISFEDWLKSYHST
jgi:hypothetical protein